MWYRSQKGWGLCKYAPEGTFLCGLGVGLKGILQAVSGTAAQRVHFYSTGSGNTKHNPWTGVVEAKFSNP